MAAVSRLLNRNPSKTLTTIRSQVCRFFFSSSSYDLIHKPSHSRLPQLPDIRGLPTLHFLIKRPFPLSDVSSPADRSGLVSPACSASHGLRPTEKIPFYNNINSFQTSKYLNATIGCIAALPRGFSSKAKGGKLVQQKEHLNHKRKGSAKVDVGKLPRVVSSTPLEVSYPSERINELDSERLKLELYQKLTFALVPILLVVSKSKVTTSVLLLSVFWLIYCFNKEILLRYVQHEIIRKWVLLYLHLLLVILVKDIILAFDVYLVT